MFVPYPIVLCFIQQELLQQLVLNSMVSTIQTTIFGVYRIGLHGYNLYLADVQRFKNLYDVQVNNKIQITAFSLIIRKQFYSYQYCYGVYSQEQTLSDFSQIRSFIGLQNQFTPFLKRKEMIAQYNIAFGQEKKVLFSQYPGQFIKDLNQSIIDGGQQMNDTQPSFYIQQLFNYTGQVFLTLDQVPESKIIIGTLFNQGQSFYSQTYIISQRSMGVLESGSLINDLLLKIGYEYIIAFVTCILFQIAFIYQLNRPLKYLQNVTKSHININRPSRGQYQQIKHKIKHKNYLRLSLIHLNQKHRNKQFQLFGKNIEFEQQQRYLLRRYSQETMSLIRRKLQKISFIQALI